jgi:hypothetical protein
MIDLLQWIAIALLALTVGSLLFQQFMTIRWMRKNRDSAKAVMDKIDKDVFGKKE